MHMHNLPACQVSGAMSSCPVKTCQMNIQELCCPVAAAMEEFDLPIQLPAAEQHQGCPISDVAMDVSWNA